MERENTAGRSGPARYEVVVGVDGSQGSEAALDWAAAAARELGTGLLIVHALSAPYSPAAVGSGARAFTVLTDAESRIHAEHPDLPVQIRVAEEEANRSLVTEGEGARLLVVGSRGRGGFSSLLLGSTSVAVSARAACPVVVVPPEASARPAGREKRVVVGVDGSDVSYAALRFAMAGAARVGGELIVVHGWELPVPMDPTALTAAGYVMDHEVFRARNERYINEIVAEARTAETESVPVRVRVVEGSPARALLDAAEHAELLVVGSRGRGGVAGLLLGSVSQSVLHRATVPVAVVRTGW